MGEWKYKPDDIDSVVESYRIAFKEPDEQPQAASRFDDLLEKMRQIHHSKRRDYGANDPLGNFKQAIDLGVKPSLGCAIRMSDKWARFCNLYRKGNENRAVKDESIIDTLLDLANYALLTIILLESESSVPTVPEDQE